MTRTGRAKAGGPPATCSPDVGSAPIHAAFHRGGELSAVVELRRLFPGLANSAALRSIARAILGWAPLPAGPVNDAAPAPCPRADDTPPG